MRRGTLSSPAELFDAAVHGAGEAELAEMGLQIVARPGMAPPVRLHPGDFAVRRALGEGRLAVLSAVEGMVEDRAALEAAGVECEGAGEGYFVPVNADAAWGRTALRIAGPEGLMRGDTVVFRPIRIAARLAEDQDAAPARVVPDLGFILDPRRSTLELLEPAERDQYLAFAWHGDDFPGGPVGPNEARAERMFRALTQLRPERRANTGDNAAVRTDEFEAMRAQLDAWLIAVPGEKSQRLHRDAAVAFVAMRAAALNDGVTLAIGNWYRSPARAQANAAAANNRAAVASFSSHMLGLAVDLNMSHGGIKFVETTTRPFQNLVAMYKSPVHKWMFLRGETHGWFPYRREPWHWEYNPSGFRDRLRQLTRDAPSPRQMDAPIAARESEAITDPIVAPTPPLVITGSVGRNGRNAAADIRAVQDRLVELRALTPADAAAERPAGAAAVADAALARTIDALDDFQRRIELPVNGQVDLASATRAELDRVIPQPTPAEFSAVASARDALGQTTSRGLTIRGAVGSVANGNAPDDVRVVQRRLVDLGRLAASHREEPAPGSTGAVEQRRLPATIAALRGFQTDVPFWLARGAISGAITPGVVTPGDATASLLDRVAVFSIGPPGARLSFHDHVVSGVTQSETGVMFVGTASPSAIPVAGYRDQGLMPGEAAALKLVSTHEGNFDAINTYDRALVSAGFIQFAGGRGLPPYLALLKARQPAKFRDLLQRYGIDVEFTVSAAARTASSRAIVSPRVAVIDPAGNRVLRAAAAEMAIRDDKRLTSALILSGRDRDVQLVQIEAAVRDYVRAALDAVVSWGPGSSRARLGEILRSQKGMAALFDRSIQEGLAAAKRRFERVIQRLMGSSDPAARPVTREMVQSREGDVLAELERDLQSAADVLGYVRKARTALDALIHAATASGGTVAAILARPELSDARQAVTNARTGLPAIVNVTTASGASVESTFAAINSTLTAEESRLALTPVPASTAMLATAFRASRQALTAIAGSLSTAPMFLARIQGIRRSSLDSSIAEMV